VTAPARGARRASGSVVLSVAALLAPAAAPAAADPSYDKNLLLLATSFTDHLYVLNARGSDVVTSMIPSNGRPYPSQVWKGTKLARFPVVTGTIFPAA
jgi:hypothetical protein